MATDLSKGGGVNPSTTPPPPWGCFFYRILEQRPIVGSKHMFSDTRSKQEVDRKYDKTRVSEGFLQQNQVINCSICIPLILGNNTKNCCGTMEKTVT